MRNARTPLRRSCAAPIARVSRRRTRRRSLRARSDVISRVPAPHDPSAARCAARAFREHPAPRENRPLYVDRYGESILLKPEQNGLGLLVWGLPVLFVVLAGGGVGGAFRRWPRTHAVT